MTWNRIQIRATDKKFSLYLRQKRNWTCEKCQKRCRDFTGTVKFASCEASHYFSRKHENTRLDEENVRVLCGSCHKKMGGYTPKEDGEYDLWIKELLGEKKYKLLKIRAFTYKQRDDKLDLLYLNQLIKNGYH